MKRSRHKAIQRWFAAVLTLLLSNQLIFIPIAFFVSFAILGCVDGIVEWKRNEQKYMHGASSTQ